jgi:hypothetical protein
MIPESYARMILLKAIDEQRASELIMALFEGGSVTIDKKTGALVIVSGAQLKDFH